MTEKQLDGLAAMFTDRMNKRQRKHRKIVKDEKFWKGCKRTYPSRFNREGKKAVWLSYRKRFRSITKANGYFDFMYKRNLILYGDWD